VRSTFVAVGVNLVLNLLFVGPLVGLGLAHRGLALATSVTSLINLTQLAWRLRARLSGIDGGRMLRSFLRITLASLVAASLLYVGLGMIGDITSHGVLVRAGVVAGGGVVGLLVLAGTLALLRVEELGMLAEMGRSFLGRFRGK
jgi:putative peptidoglycan lipid II flippase